MQMDNKTLAGVLMLLGSVFIAAFSQILLKCSARRQYTGQIAEYLNPLVMIGYILLMGTTFINVLALRWVPLSLASALDASGQIFVPLLSFFILNEKISRKKILGMIVIVIGILFFSF